MGDKAHPLWKEIHETLTEMDRRLHEFGYMPLDHRVLI